LPAPSSDAVGHPPRGKRNRLGVPRLLTVHGQSMANVGGPQTSHTSGSA
jgi:hypothetical protein